MNFDDLKNALDSMNGKYHPGIDILIHQDSKEIFRYQTGYSDVENKIPVDPNALYYMFSCTKPITCTAALQLYEKGLFLIDDPIREYLPEFSDMYVKTVDENGNERIEKADKDITIKHLFTMTSGITYNLETKAIEEVKRKTNGVCKTADIVKAIAKEPLSFHPGEGWEYGLNHDILGRLIEVLSNMTFGEYVKKNIFEKCGMTDSYFKADDEIRKRMPYMYTGDNDGNLIKRENICEYRFGEDSDYESGGAGLISCVDDYIKFTDMMANGGVSPNTGERVINKGTIDIMRTNCLSGDVLTEWYKKRYVQGYGYGLGVRTFIDKTNGISNIGEFGWDGAAGSYLIIDPEKKLSLFSARYTRKCCNKEVNLRIRNIVYSILDRG